MNDYRLTLSMVCRQAQYMIGDFLQRSRRPMVTASSGKAVAGHSMGEPIHLPEPDGDPAFLRIAYEGREVRIPVSEYDWALSLDDFAQKVLWEPLKRLTSYDAPIGA